MEESDDRHRLKTGTGTGKNLGFRIQVVLENQYSNIPYNQSQDSSLKSQNPVDLKCKIIEGSLKQIRN